MYSFTRPSRPAALLLFKLLIHCSVFSGVIGSFSPYVSILHHPVLNNLYFKKNLTKIVSTDISLLKFNVLPTSSFRIFQNNLGLFKLEYLNVLIMSFRCLL